MKRAFTLSFIIFISMSINAQDDEYQRYLESQRNKLTDLYNETKKGTDSLITEYKDYKVKAITDFADFMAKEWALFEDFKNQELSMTVPKLNKIPEAVKSEITEVVSTETTYTLSNNLPEVSKTTDNKVKNDVSPYNNYAIRKVVTKDGVRNVINNNSFNNNITPQIKTENNISIDFYGIKLDFTIDDKLRYNNKGVKESDVSNYVKEMAKFTKETEELWQQIDKHITTLGLNEWGYYCMTRAISESILTNYDNRVLFIFYMLRNEGNFKVKVAKGKDSDKLILLAAIDNSKEVYSYTFFRLDDGNDTKVKYYTIYGDGNANESVYTYDHYSHDTSLKQIGLDFNSVLNMGPCDRSRELSFSKINTTISLPYNSSHMAYLNDVPMTVFPIYFASPISIEAQRVLNNKLNEIKSQYTPIQFIDIILNFVQTAFEYKTDEQQFGYEKYFYPEEVLGYPYSDCEDRSALFAWLVTNYTNAKVVGLQYEGHLATAVYFGENTNIQGDVFSYGGKKYYVCDPTYINASIGMTMPQFKDKTPKIIKMNK